MTTPQYLNGHLLLAMPSMSDPRFEKSVIYVCAHDENGAMGIVINNKLADLEFGNLLKDLEIESNITLPPDYAQLPVLSGGPVEAARGFLIHSNDFEQHDTIKVQDDIFVTGTIDAISAIGSGNVPATMIFALGYAGWTEGQLEQEIRDSAWLTIPATPDLIFSKNIDAVWSKALSTMGITPDKLAHLVGSTQSK